MKYFRKIQILSMSQDEALRLLGLDPKENIDEDKLKNAYRQAAKKHHPDIGGNVEMMQKVNNAYELMKNKNMVKKVKITKELDKIEHMVLNIYNKFSQSYLFQERKNIVHVYPFTYEGSEADLDVQLRIGDDNENPAIMYFTISYDTDIQDKPMQIASDLIKKKIKSNKIDDIQAVKDYLALPELNKAIMDYANKYQFKILHSPSSTTKFA